MFTTYFNETHEEARRNIRRFVERHVTPHINEWEEAGTFPREIYKKAADLGLLGIGIALTFGAGVGSPEPTSCAPSSGSARSSQPPGRAMGASS